LKKNITILTIIIFNAFLYFVRADDKIAPPVLKLVSYNPFTDSLSLYWEKGHGDDSIASYEIRKWTFNELEGWRLNDENPEGRIKNDGSTSYRYKKYISGVNPSSSAYSIIAIDTSGNEGTSEGHELINCDSRYDSCNARVIIKWSPYTVFKNEFLITPPLSRNIVDNQIQSYRIYRGQVDSPKGSFQKIGSVSGDDTVYIDETYQRGNIYQYYIEAIKSGFKKYRNRPVFSTSNLTTVNTSMAREPDSLYAMSSIVRNGELVFRFFIDPGTEIQDFEIHKSRASDGSFERISRINISDSIYEYSSPYLQSADHYKLLAFNYCNDTVAESNPLNHMQLKTNQEMIAPQNNNYQIELEWNKLIGWKNGVSHYRLSRSGNKEPKTIELSPATTVYTDMLSMEETGQISSSGYICYRVEAMEAGSPSPTPGRSLSNRACVHLNPGITMPNAFNPLDPVNEDFTFYMSFVPVDFYFAVYSRQGSQVFETTEHGQYWDGRLPNGSYAAEGVYHYYMNLTMESGKNIKRRGQITLFYDK